MLIVDLRYDPVNVARQLGTPTRRRRFAPTRTCSRRPATQTSRAKGWASASGTCSRAQV